MQGHQKIDNKQKQCSTHNKQKRTIVSERGPQLYFTLTLLGVVVLELYCICYAQENDAMEMYKLLLFTTKNSLNSPLAPPPSQRKKTAEKKHNVETWYLLHLSGSSLGVACNKHAYRGCIQNLIFSGRHS